MTDPTLIVEDRGDGVVLLTLNRPDKRNALDAALRQALIDECHRLADDSSVRAVVLTGAGGTFCAGFDLDELMNSAAPDGVFAHATAYHHAVHTFPKPLIAAVERAAVAGGMDLALMCDIRVAASDARFGQPQVKFGVPAAFDLVATVMPESAARQLCLTGRLIDADTAASAGVVTQVVDPGTALEHALQLAAEIASVAGAVQTKRAIIASQPPLFAPLEDSP